MFKKFQNRQDINLLAEEKLYEYVAKEMEVGEIRQGLWAKATAQASSAHDADIRRKYIELRVEYLQAEGRLTQQFLEEIETASENEVTSEPNWTETQNASEDDSNESLPPVVTVTDIKVGVAIMVVIIILVIFSLGLTVR